MSQLIFFCFQRAYYAAATISCECDHNSGPTSTSANHHDIGPFQRSPNQHPSTLLGELAFFQLVITRVLLLCRKKEKHSQERRKAWLQRVQVRHACSHPLYTICCCIDLPYSYAEHLDLIFNHLLSLYTLGLVGELLSSTSTRYSDSTAAPSPHPSPPHSTQ